MPLTGVSTVWVLVGLDCAEDVDTLEVDLIGLDGVGKSSKEYSVKGTQR